MLSGQAFRDRVGMPLGDFFTQAPLGAYPEISIINIRGKAFNIDKSPITVWPRNELYSYPDAQKEQNILAIASTDDRDKSSSIGAHSILIEGLDNDFKLVSEKVWLDGKNPVVLHEEFVRINKIQTIAWGAKSRAIDILGTGNFGTISIGIGEFKDGVPNKSYCVMTPHDNISATGVYTVPVAHTLMAYSPHVHIENTNQARVKFSSRNYEQSGFITDFEAGANPVLNSPKFFAQRYNEKTDLHIWADMALKSIKANIYASQECFLIKNSCWR